MPPRVEVEHTVSTADPGPSRKRGKVKCPGKVPANGIRKVQLDRPRDDRHTNHRIFSRNHVHRLGADLSLRRIWVRHKVETAQHKPTPDVKIGIPASEAVETAQAEEAEHGLPGPQRIRPRRTRLDREGASGEGMVRQPSKRVP
jgi:hypothetical protein